MNIILFYQHVGRELYSIKKLEKILTERGHSVFVYSIDFEFDTAIRKAKKIRIDIIVSPWMYHDTNYQDFVPFIRTNGNIKIINLHSEQIYSPFSKVVLLPAKGAASDYVYHFCWGESFKNDLLSIGIPKELIYVTGSMRNDEAFGTSLSKEELSKRYDLNPKKKWILFAENRNFIKNTNILNGEFLKKGVSEKELIERYDYTKAQLIATIEDINSLPDEFFDCYELIYRAHPGFQGDMGVTNLRVNEISDLSIYEWINASEVCVVWNSTSAFESDMMHVPVIVCSKDAIPEKYETIGLNNYKHISYLMDLINIDLNKILQEQEAKKNYVYYYGEIDGNATINVANAIETISLNQDEYKAELIPVDLKHQIRWRINLIVTRILIKIKLFDVFKFPRSSYQHKSDIPFYKAKKN